MSRLDEIRERTRARKAAGLNQSYPHHAGRAVTLVPSGRTPLPALAECRHGGTDADVMERCEGCAAGALHVRECLADHGPNYEPGKCTREPSGNARIMSCRQCQAQSLGFEPPARPARFTAGADVAVGVAIGSYGWPELVDLQCRVIRDTCGPVPVLVSSDRPESDAALQAVCAAHTDVTHDPNPERIGHTGGDVAVFHKAIVWGAARGLRVVAKLSQRFLVTRPRWLHDGAAELLASGLPIATRRCRGKEVFDLRTEAALLDVRRWNAPDVLARIVPRRYWTDSPKGMTAETVLHRVLKDLLGGVYWPWSLYTDDRYQRAEGTLWHCTHAAAEYRRLAERYGVTLPPDFHCDGWQRDLAKGKYLYG